MDNNQNMDRVAERDARMLLKREEDKIIIRRGEVGNDQDGTPLLINYRGEAYRVNDTAVSLWNMCNGITFEDLYLEVLRISSGDEDDVRRSLEKMVKQFHKISVVEMKETASSADRRPGMQT